MVTPPRRNAVEVLSQEEARIRSDIARLQAELAGITKARALIDGSESVDPSASTINLPPPGTVKGALVDILRTEPNGLPTQELVRRAKKEHGVKSDDRTIASFLSRLKKDGVVGLQDGRYKLAVNKG